MPTEIATRTNFVKTDITDYFRVRVYSRFLEDARRVSHIFTVLARVINTTGAAVIFFKAGLPGSFLAVVFFALATLFYAAFTAAV